MTPNELDALVQLDAGLPVVDPEVGRLTSELQVLLDGPALEELERGYAHGVAVWLNHYMQAGNGTLVEADVAFLFELVHAAVPASTPQPVVTLLDLRLARLIEVAANIASGGPTSRT